MNSEKKTKWVEALRSGEYEQGASFLVQQPASAKGKPRYCCLGVLCDLAIKDGVEGIRFIEGEGLALGPHFELYLPADPAGGRDFDCDLDNGDEPHDMDWFEIDDETLPSVVSTWAGLNSDNPMLGQYPASTWNDGQDAGDPERSVAPQPFTAIADKIEEHL
jgi:hypothetical protein